MYSDHAVDFIWFTDEKSVYRRSTIQPAERSGLCAKKRHIDPSRLLRTSAMVSVAVSQMGMTELIFVNPGVNVRPYCNVLLSQQVLPAIKREVSQNVVYSQNNTIAYGEILSFLCSVISQGKVVALDR